MKASELDAIRARCEAATPGEWWTKYGERYVYASDERQTIICDAIASPMNPTVFADNSFIAHARSDVPALLAEVRRLRGLVEAAYREGLEQGHSFSWDESNAKRQLEGL